MIPQGIDLLLMHSLIFCSFVSKTALLVAVTANQPDIVQDLLYLGADIGICDVNGQTALHLAATYGFPRVMEVRDHPHAKPLKITKASI